MSEFKPTVTISLKEYNELKRDLHKCKDALYGDHRVIYIEETYRDTFKIEFGQEAIKQVDDKFHAMERRYRTHINELEHVLSESIDRNRELEGKLIKKRFRIF